MNFSIKFTKNLRIFLKIKSPKEPVMDIQRVQQSGQKTVALQTSIIDTLSHVLTQEAQSITTLSSNIPLNSQILIEKILTTKGKIIFSGMGKSGLVGKKLAATYAGVGIPAIFLHPAEALHGELGILQPQDLLIALSKSATGPELEYVFAFTKAQNIFSVLWCCSDGILCHKADLVIKLPFEREACPLNLAPTSSATMMMAFGDALAVVASTLNGFGKIDFARFHPAGALGKQLLFTIHSFMYTKDALPIVLTTTLFKDLLYIISSKKLGACIVVNDKQELCGLVTDGDLRRACEQKGDRVFSCCAQDIMIKQPKTIAPETLACHALTIMERHNITSLIVTQNNKAIGFVHIHDLIKAGLKGEI